jgi:hypothetical protein
MDELVRVKNSSYERYEELILRRDNVRKEGFIYEMKYTEVFGELIVVVFEEQLNCVRKKKTIEFCQAAVNHGKDVEQKELQAFVEAQTKKLKDNLEDMVSEYEASKNSTKITDVEQLKIKKIYHTMVKMIHPDINPMVKDSEELQDLWNRTVVAYNCNDLSMLQEVEVLATKVMNSISGGHQIEIEIPNIEDKIAQLEDEIRKLMDAEPYQYKFLLADRELVEDKKDSLKQELKTYQDYGKQLDAILNGLLASGVKVTWKMNWQK